MLFQKRGIRELESLFSENLLLPDNGYLTFYNVRITVWHFLVSKPPYIGAYCYRLALVAAVPAFLGIISQVDQLTPAVEDTQLVFVHRSANNRAEEVVLTITVR